jgi:hypothetical protein
MAGHEGQASRSNASPAATRRGEHEQGPHEDPKHRDQRPELWQAAGELARIHGLNPTAAALRLNYYDLQRRMRRDPVARRGRRRSATFIEVPALPLPANGGEVGTVELVQGSGARLILRLPQAAAKDLLPVVQLFLRRRP